MTVWARRRHVGFWFEGREWRELRDPDGSPTAKQLLKLNALGTLELVHPGSAEPVTKAEAAALIDEAEA